MIGVLDLDQIGYKNVDARALITGFQFLQVNAYLHFSMFINVIALYLLTDIATT